MDVASDVDRRTKSCIGTLNKIRSNTSIRITKAVENEFIDQRTAGMANKNIERYYSKFELQSATIGLIKKRAILGKWFSPESDLEKDIYNKIKKKEEKKQQTDS